MFRKYILASAISLALLPGDVGALGLGGIRARSALNEPFSGRIELLDVAPDRIGTVKVSLASEDEFDKVGAPRPDFLTGLSFTPGVSSEGRPIIQIASTQPVREPYLDFLIEVNSPAGRVVKEYTVLLDPPVTLDSPPPRVEQAAIEPPAPQRNARSDSPPGHTPAPASTDPAAFPMRYGPVRSGDGLWKIARKMAKTSGASVAQTAMALYRSNQGAFIRGDINRLKIGNVLEIPTSAELLALDAGQAEREFEAALRGDSVASAPLAKIPAAPKAEDRLKIAGASEPVSPKQANTDMPPGEPSAEPTGQEAGVPETADGEAVGTVGDGTAPGLGAIKQDLLLVQEAGASALQETADLRGRIRELETQLADIQRLLKLSDERFVQLQSARLLELQEGQGSDGTDEAPTADAGELAKPTDPTVAPGEGDSAKTAAAPTPIEAPPAEPPFDAEAPEPTQHPDSPTGFWESMPQPLLALAIPPLLLVLGWMIYKRRKSLEETSKPDELTAEASEMEMPVDATADRSVEQSAEQSAESVDASVPPQSLYSGFGNLEDETEEADIVSEADVYIAYGRYREAEALLEEEVNKAPDRLDVKFKLAEAYHGVGNLADMEAIMSQIQQTGADRNNPEQWRRLDGMLRDLKGENADDSGAFAAATEPPTAADRGPAKPLEAGFPPPVPPNSLGRNLPGTEDAASAMPSTAGVPDRRPQDLDLDLEDLDLDDLDIVSEIPRISVSEERPEMSEAGTAASDLELHLDDLGSLRDLDLASFANRMSPAEQPPAEDETPPSADAGADPLDVESAGKDSLASDVLSSQWQMESGLWDEVATKIDLARAYMEMDDPEAARVILEEVAQEGSDDQRSEAREMMEQLG